MTKLNGKMERESALQFQGKALIVGLEEPGYVTVRLKGLRQSTERVSAVSLYEFAVKRRVEAELEAVKQRSRKKPANRGLIRRGT